MNLHTKPAPKQEAHWVKSSYGSSTTHVMAVGDKFYICSQADKELLSEGMTPDDLNLTAYDDEPDLNGDDTWGRDYVSNGRSQSPLNYNARRGQL
jgi:hypothetical protein